MDSDARVTSLVYSPPRFFSQGQASFYSESIQSFGLFGVLKRGFSSH